MTWLIVLHHDAQLYNIFLPSARIPQKENQRQIILPEMYIKVGEIVIHIQIK